jgi:5-formyltetrahydrofolate cyclo-ligase
VAVNDRRALRKALRAARAAIPPRQRRAAAAQIARWIAGTHWLVPDRRIGLYAALGDELDTAPLLELISRRRCLPYFPRLESLRARRMTFSPIGPHHRRNRYGIVEPATAERETAAFLEIIFLPLVGFDSQGNRLGMGAGFYDRALAFRRRRRHWRGPLLVGLAYAHQEVAAIKAAPTDVALDAVVTEQGIRFFRGAQP